MGVLGQLYEGNLLPKEQGRRTSQEYRRVMEEASWLEEHLAKQLNDELRNELNRVLAARTELMPHEEAAIFVQGMQLGAQFALELTGWQGLNQEE